MPFEEKESYCWFQGYQRACEVAKKHPAAEVVTVGDRESDISEIYADWPRRCQCGERRAEVLVRAGRDRALLDSDKHLFQTMRAGQELGTYQVKFASKAQLRKIKGSNHLTQRLGRKATLQGRSTKVCLSPPIANTANASLAPMPVAGSSKSFIASLKAVAASSGSTYAIVLRCCLPWLST